MRFLLTAALILFVLSPAQAFACRCAAMTEAKSKEIIENASMIFEGRVVGMTQREIPEEYDYLHPPPVIDNPFFSKLRLKVLNGYKLPQDLPENARIEAYMDTTTSCGYMVQEGDVVDLVLTHLEGSDIFVQVDNCSIPLAEHMDALKAGKPVKVSKVSPVPTREDAVEKMIATEQRE